MLPENNIYGIPSNGSLMKFHICLCMLLLSAWSQSFSQSKKVQIETLSERADSLNKALIENRLSYEKRIENLDSVNISLRSQIKRQAMEEADRLRTIDDEMIRLKDSLAHYKSEFHINELLLNTSEFCNSFNLKKERIGNITVASTEVTRYNTPDGTPDENWNGDSWNDVVCIYLIRSNEGVNSIILEDCFSHNKKSLLDEINRIARQQFIEDKEIAEECGGDIKFPLIFNDLEMHINGNEVCFEYDVGTWKGNVCGSPRDNVCFTKAYIEKFLH